MSNMVKSAAMPQSATPPALPKAASGNTLSVNIVGNPPPRSGSNTVKSAAQEPSGKTPANPTYTRGNNIVKSAATPK